VLSYMLYVVVLVWVMSWWYLWVLNVVLVVVRLVVNEMIVVELVNLVWIVRLVVMLLRLVMGYSRFLLLSWYVFGLSFFRCSVRMNIFSG